MGTTFQVFAHKLDEAVLQWAVPPQIQPEQVGQLDWDGEKYSMALSPDALQDAREILPCLSILNSEAWGYQFTLEGQTRTGDRFRAALDPIGAFDPVERNGEETAVESAIDLLHIRQPLQTANLCLRGQGIDLNAPTLLSISIRKGTGAPDPELANSGTRIEVPPRSQMVLRPELASHVCSPTSVAMILDHYDLRTDIYELIAEARHQPSGLHGVWPANIRAAARRGLLGYLLHFPSWNAAQSLLDEGLPIVASVRYEEGELSSAAIRRTRGHLLVVRGYEGDEVLVNDPAASTDSEVVRAYRLEEFCNVWLRQSAVGYVFFPLNT